MGCGFDFAEVGLNGLGAFSVAAHGVHGLGVDGGYFVGHGAGFGVTGGEAEHEVLDADLRGVGEDVELSVARVLGGEGIGFLPFGVDVAVEVGSGGDRVVNLCGVEAVEVLLSLQA